MASFRKSAICRDRECFSATSCSELHRPLRDPSQRQANLACAGPQSHTGAHRGSKVRVDPKRRRPVDRSVDLEIGVPNYLSSVLRDQDQQRLQVVIARERSLGTLQAAILLTRRLSFGPLTITSVTASSAKSSATGLSDREYEPLRSRGVHARVCPAWATISDPQLRAVCFRGMPPTNHASRGSLEQEPRAMLRFTPKR